MAQAFEGVRSIAVKAEHAGNSHKKLRHRLNAQSSSLQNTHEKVILLGEVVAKRK